MERNNNQNDLLSKLAKLQNDTDIINKQLIDNTLSDNNNNETIAEKLRSFEEKQEEISVIQESHREALKDIFEKIEKNVNNHAETFEVRSTFKSDVSKKLYELTDGLKLMKEEQELQKESIESLRKQRSDDATSIQKISEELSELALKEKEQKSSKEKSETISTSKEEQLVEEMRSIREQLEDLKKKQETQEIFNTKVISEFKATQREIASLNKKESDEFKKNTIPIEKEIVGLWKPSSLNDYKHYVKPDDPVKRSYWLSGQLLYSLKADQFTYKLIVIENELKDVVKNTTVQLGKQKRYAEHSETWTFDNNHLLIVFKNKTDESVIKKHFQFILDGKLHIVYHDLANDVTSTRIYDRVI